MRDSLISSSDTDAARLATCMCRCCGSWSLIIGVTGCSTSRSLRVLTTTTGTSPTVGGLEDRPQLGLEVLQGRHVAGR